MKARQLFDKEEFDAHLDNVIQAAIRFGAERRTYSGLKKLNVPKTMLNKAKNDVVAAEQNLSFAEVDLQDAYTDALHEIQQLKQDHAYDQKKRDAYNIKLEKKIARRYEAALKTVNVALAALAPKLLGGVQFEDALSRVEAAPVSERQVMDAIKEFNTYKSETEM